MHGFLAAVGFLTRIPIGVVSHADAEHLGRSSPYFPLVGGVIGLVLAMTDRLASRFFVPVVVSALDLAMIFVLTGGMHLDGLIDTADGLLSGRGKERILEIMRDSRVGAMGVIAGILLVILKFSLLTAIPPQVRPYALFLMPVLGRWVMLSAIVFFPYARQGPGLGRIFARKVSIPVFLITTVLTMTVCAVLGGARGCAAFFGSAVASLWLARSISRFLGGLTGDVYGALAEVGEAIGLAFFAARI